MERTKGYVIGEDEGVFKVRVQGGFFDGKKLIVESTHYNCRLAVRLNVDFIIGMVQGRDEAFPVAVDARPIEAVPKCDDMHCKDDAEILMEVSGSDAKSADYLRTCLPHFPLQLLQAQSVKVFGRRIIKVINVAKSEKNWRTLVGIC